jgi:GntR family carbon starvation induced transcriptional regulator
VNASVTGSSGPRSSGSGAGRTQTSVAIDRLRADIVSGRFRPSEKLRVQPLAERYGFAASALREALSRLVTDGLVEVEDQRGFRVSPVSREDLLDLTETRVGIEGMALSLAIRHGDVAWESGIIGAFHRLSRSSRTADSSASGIPPWANAHREFHHSLIAACRSEWLLYFCGVLYEQSERYRLLVLYSKPQMRDTREEHEELMNVVIRRDIAGACALLDQHFRETTRLILEIDKTLGGPVAASSSAASDSP